MFPSIRGLAIGLYRTFFDLGGFVGPFIVTIIVDSYGYTIVFYVMAGLMLLNLIISSSLRRKAVS
jgi:MFS family permease